MEACKISSSLGWSQSCNLLNVNSVQSMGSMSIVQPMGHGLVRALYGPWVMDGTRLYNPWAMDGATLYGPWVMDDIMLYNPWGMEW